MDRRPRHAITKVPPAPACHSTCRHLPDLEGNRPLCILGLPLLVGGMGASPDHRYGFRGRGQESRTTAGCGGMGREWCEEWDKADTPVFIHLFSAGPGKLFTHLIYVTLQAWYLLGVFNSGQAPHPGIRRSFHPGQIYDTHGCRLRSNGGLRAREPWCVPRGNGG